MSLYGSLAQRPSGHQACSSATTSCKQRSLKVWVALRAKFIANVTLFCGRCLLRKDIRDTGQDDNDGSIENRRDECSAQESNLNEVHKQHTDGFADVLPDCIQHLEEVLIEEGLQDESKEDEYSGTPSPHAEEVTTSEDPILHNHVPETGKCPGNLQARKLHWKRALVGLQSLLVQNGHKAADEDFRDRKENSEGAESHSTR
mmetsp:Transcript_46085/g.100093  ORF Transcript_46085/g.100093 Transcript_46085/m.100093 type:complete len:202 (+) Transcript_46085:34-639(+)